MTDEEGVRQTLGAFCHYLDERRFDEWSRLFTEDGVFGAVPEQKGREVILDWILHAELATMPELRRKHMMANSIIDVSGDEADAVSDLVMFDYVSEGNWSIRVGRYTDRLVRQGDQWLFARRHLVFI